MQVIVLTEPRTRHQLSGRKKALERALEGLGQHGLVGTSEGALVHLQDALRAELDQLLQQLKAATQKLDALAAAGPQRVSLSHGPAPTTASHQRQLSLRQAQVQERLIKNKTLLNRLEPVAQAAKGLENLLNLLRRRIQFDKDVLFQVPDSTPLCLSASLLLFPSLRHDKTCLRMQFWAPGRLTKRIVSAVTERILDSDRRQVVIRKQCHSREKRRYVNVLFL